MIARPMNCAARNKSDKESVIAQGCFMGGKDANVFINVTVF